MSARILIRAAYALFVAVLAGAMASLSGCARVHQRDREFLSDPIMQRIPDPMSSGIESHNRPRREGAVGGSSGSGGGCGC
jgi:hypothetical protein